MKCLICNTDKFITKHSYSEPDKYEVQMGITDINRSWLRCLECGFYMQARDYDIERLIQIYYEDYRAKDFRGEDIESAFNRINAIDNNENEQRYIWFAANIAYAATKNILDIGSGLGVWPHILRSADFEVDCLEQNKISLVFLRSMGFRCFDDISDTDRLYDCITIIHVLEHIEDPCKFLALVRHRLKSGGYLFVEVPDSIEFKYLDKDHDEFNSCHLTFYDPVSLLTILSRAGFVLTDMHRARTTQRNLSRIMCLAINK